MQYRVELVRTMDVPRATVAAVLGDLPGWPAWDPYVVAMERDDDGRGDSWTPGARWVERVRRGPFRPRFRLTVGSGHGSGDGSGAGIGGGDASVEPGRRFEWTATYLFVHARYVWTLADAPSGGCEVRSRETFSGPAPVPWLTRGLLRLFQVERMTAASLAVLEAAAERAAKG